MQFGNIAQDCRDVKIVEGTKGIYDFPGYVVKGLLPVKKA